MSLWGTLILLKEISGIRESLWRSGLVRTCREPSRCNLFGPFNWKMQKARHPRALGRAQVSITEVYQRIISRMERTTGWRSQLRHQTTQCAHARLPRHVFVFFFRNPNVRIFLAGDPRWEIFVGDQAPRVACQRGRGSRESFAPGSVLACS